MIVVRDIFQVKFGRMKEARELMVSMLKSGGRLGVTQRLLTDLTGPYYTLVMEGTYKDLTDYEATMRKEMGRPEMGATYQKFTPLVDSGHREIFTIVE